ncbi:MAG TPA: SDR family NAD(P)-dependent oxidoreductase, partial [Rhodospirillales bacterium]|nr:SDR family NAD(P)-dependent oxidoreductase [Rhodospirillales bacterium]
AEDDACALDLVIANAGVSAETSGNAGDSVRAVMAVNLAGVLNTVLPALPRMQKRKAGKIALMSSLAAFRGLPSAPAYCASKAAVKSWGEALRGRVWRDGVRVSVVCPGFVKSRITDRNAFAMPFLMDADKAARIIKAGIAKDKARIAFPLPLVLAVQLLGALPPSWTDLLLRRMPMKE